jgi:hypothetical protein
MRLILLSLTAALIAVQAPRSAPAQPQVSVPLVYLEIEPEQLAETAFSILYGRMIIAEFAAVVAESADAACLKTNGIEKSALEGRARAITIRHGAQQIRKYASAVDRAAFKSSLASSMGAGSEAELSKLRENNDVRAFMALAAPARDAAIVNTVTETLDRNILILKFKLSRRFNPLATGDIKLLNADPSDAIQDKLEALVAANKSAALTRYIELMDAAQDALNQSIDTKALLSTRIVDLMPGLDKDLTGVCILRSQ